MNEKDLHINEEIREKKIRVIDETGKQLGVMQTSEALQLAESKNLELVKIAPMANPPVCKIMDYGKFKFDQSKKLKESKKNQKLMAVKEIRVTLNINEHDLNTKIRNAIKLLNLGNKIKICVRFKGREKLRANAGFELIEKIKLACSDYGSVDKPAKFEGSNLTTLVVPKLQKK